MSLVSILEMTQAFQFFESTYSVNHSDIYLLQLTLAHATGLEYQGFIDILLSWLSTVYTPRSYV